MAVELYDYQKNIVDQIHNEFENCQSVLLQMPTGTGKTEVFSQIIKDYYTNFPDNRIIVIVHREQLMNQIKVRLRKFNLVADTVESSKKINENPKIHICMRQTLIKRNPLFSKPSLIIIDEAHHAASNENLQLLNKYKGENTKLLGVTATPIRLDGKSLSDIFQKIIESNPFSWFIPRYLSPLKYYGIRGSKARLNKLNIHKIRNDYDDESSYQMMREDRVMKEIITSYTTLAEGKKTLIFCVNQEHAIDVKQRFDEVGILSEIINSKTKRDDRLVILKKFDENKISILINIEIFTEGFDCPDIEVVILARPTQSLALYLQMIGRVTRKSIDGSKKYGIVLDNAGNWNIHDLPTVDRNWTEIFHSISEDTDGWIPVLKKNQNNLIKKIPLPFEDVELNMYELSNPNDITLEEDPEDETFNNLNFTMLENSKTILIHDNFLKAYIIFDEKNLKKISNLDMYAREIIKSRCSNIINDILSLGKEILDSWTYEYISFDIIKPISSSRSDNIICITPESSFKENTSKILLDINYKRIDSQISDNEDRLFAFLWNSLKIYVKESLV
jgi:superfamily II DNA or RNA helicase